jgi:protein O-mannosyl-transferase
MALFGWGVWLLIKKNVLAFPVFFYLFCLALVSNLVMDIGATMGERLIFHSSLGFVILVAYGIFTLAKKWSTNKRKNFILGLTSILALVFGYETMARNLDWKNDVKLFTHDVTIATNSTMLNGNAGARFIDIAQHTKDSVSKRNKLDTAIMYLRKSIVLHKKSPYVSSYLNMGDAYYELQMPDSAQVYWVGVKQAYPTYPNLQTYFSILGKLYLSVASRYGARHNYQAAVVEIKKGIRINPGDADLWYNLGGAYFTLTEYDSAYYAWNKSLQLNPNQAEAKRGLAALVPAKKK